MADRARNDRGGGRPSPLSGRPPAGTAGGGIAATADLFVLHLLGYDDLAVYDASMTEWANDSRLPMEGG